MTQSYYPTKAPTIFYLNDDPETVASWYFDRHLITYAGHCAQLLSAVWHAEGLVTTERGTEVMPGWRFANDYRTRLFSTQVFPTLSSWTDNPEHIDWARALGGNYLWTRRLGLALLDEHAFRFDKPNTEERRTIAQLRDMLAQFEVLPQRLEATRYGWFEAPYNLDETFRKDDAVSSFQAFYAVGLRGIQGWTRRPRPDFINDLLEEHNLLTA